MRRKALKAPTTSIASAPPVPPPPSDATVFTLTVTPPTGGPGGQSEIARAWLSPNATTVRCLSEAPATAPGTAKAAPPLLLPHLPGLILLAAPRGEAGTPRRIRRRGRTALPHRWDGVRCERDRSSPPMASSHLLSAADSAPWAPEASPSPAYMLPGPGRVRVGDRPLVWHVYIQPWARP